MIIEKRKIAELNPAPYNPRKSDVTQEANLKASLEKFGVVDPIIFNKQTGNIVGGHFRVRELKKLGVEEVDCVILDLSPEDEKELNIRLNANSGSWDMELLSEWDKQDLEEWGLELEWVEETPEAEEDNFEVPDVIETDIVLGDLIEIGEHRLLCGDSTDSDSVAKLMDGEKADMVFTDPPFDLEDLSFTDNLFLFTIGHIFILNSEQRNVDISAKHRDYLTRWYAVDFRQAHLVSNNAPMARVDYVAEFRNSEKVTFNNTNDGFTTLIESAKIHSNKGDTVHKQEKRIDLPALFQIHFSNNESIILDLFLGSGSTMVAAHQLKRKCYGMELDPKYCQVIIDRMKKLDPDLSIKINGKDYTNGKQ